MNSIGFTKDSLKQTEVMNDWKSKSRIGLSSLSKMQNLRDATRAMEYFLVVARSTLRPSVHPAGEPELIVSADQSGGRVPPLTTLSEVARWAREEEGRFWR